LRFFNDNNRMRLHPATLATSVLLTLSLVFCGCGGVSSSSPTGGGTSDPGGGAGGGTGGGQAAACGAMSTGVGASLNGFRPFTSANLWNTDISSSPVDPNSTAIINFIGSGIGLHPDFGSGEYNGSDIGIPYTIVAGTQGMVGINFTAYGDESDPGPMPFPANAPIEGDPNPGNGDRHSLMLDTGNCFLYELYSTYPNSDGTYNAASALRRSGSRQDSACTSLYFAAKPSCVYAASVSLGGEFDESAGCPHGHASAAETQL
jgi:hypothetical protein